MTPQKIKELRKYLEYHTTKDASKFFNVTEPWIKEICKMHDIAYYRYVNEIEQYRLSNKMSMQEMKKFFREHTKEELLNIFNVVEHKLTTYSRARNLTWKRVYKRIQKILDRDKKILELKDDHTYEEIGKTFGISRQRVEQIIKHYKK